MRSPDLGGQARIAMSGTDSSKPAILGGPAVILVRPQLGMNIGMVARAMLNCGLNDLRLVEPRDGWPNPAAESAASGAMAVLEGARLYDSTAAAIAGLHRVYATSARWRDIVKPIVTPRQAAAELRAAAAEGNAIGLLFGPERAGLLNEDVAVADAVIAVPLNPAFASLNLAQAVFIVGYEWFQAATDVPPRQLPFTGSRSATKAELINFFERLERALDTTNFFRPPEKRPSMVLNLRDIFARADLSEQEIRTLHGVVSALIDRREWDEPES
jgi:tRNA/rRNA methyltransferase